MLQTTRILFLLAALFCASISVKAQSVAWKTKFPIPAAYTWRTNYYDRIHYPPGPANTNQVDRFINVINPSAGDGIGGSVWAGTYSESRYMGSTTNYLGEEYPWEQTVTHFEGTNHLRVLWINKKGKHIFTNDMQFAGIVSYTNSYSSHNAPYAQINFLRCTTNEVHFQVMTDATNFMRRISKVNSTFYVKTTPLRKGEWVMGNARPVTDQYGFTSLLQASKEITRYTIK